MNATVAWLAMGLAAGAAIRSTWSPCGLSMLSTVTAMAERARGGRFWLTAMSFVVGSVAGGATLGAASALLAAGVRAVDPSATTALATAVAVAASGALIDAGTFGVRPPFFRRQLDDAWLQRYRSWVYGLGFGWQIGVGLATYIMTAAVVSTAMLAALTAGPSVAFAVCALFGLLRGLAVLLGARVTSPARLVALHRRFDSLEAPVRHAVVTLQLVVATIAAALAWGPTPAMVVAAGLALAAVLPSLPRRRSAPTRQVATTD